MKIFVNPKFKYRAKIKKLREEVKYWKRKCNSISKKYEKDMRIAEEQKFRSRYGDFGRDL